MRKIQFFLVGYFLLLFGGGCAAVQRRFLFFPTHHNRDNGLVPWELQGKVIGYSRPVASPENVWLMLHGNGGQAADRVSALPSFSTRDAVFILEYPGYGAREGEPSRQAFDAAAKEAYRALRAEFPGRSVCVAGESLGSGPASMLAGESQPPDKIVLVVPFDRLARVAAHHASFMPVELIMNSTWDNVSLLSSYRGPVEIFGAAGDTVIPIEHAKRLAAGIPSARFHVIEGGHNEWSQGGRVAIRNP